MRGSIEERSPPGAPARSSSLNRPSALGRDAQAPPGPARRGVAWARNQAKALRQVFSPPPRSSWRHHRRRSIVSRSGHAGRSRGGRSPWWRSGLGSLLTLAQGDLGECTRGPGERLRSIQLVQVTAVKSLPGHLPILPKPPAREARVAAGQDTPVCAIRSFHEPVESGVKRSADRGLSRSSTPPPASPADEISHFSRPAKISDANRRH